MSMLNVEEYYERELKGKKDGELIDIIFDLRKEIESLEGLVENPGVLKYMNPSPDVCLSMTRDYLKRAEQAYEEVCPKEDDGPEALLQLIELLEACQKNNPRKDEEINWEDIDE